MNHNVRVGLDRIRRRIPGWAMPAILKLADSLDLPRRGIWHLAHGRPAVPPFSMRRRVGSRTLSQYAKVGREGAADIERILEGAGRQLRNGGRVLDWGCGSGRIALQLLESQQLDLYGCDVDHDAIRWLRAVVPDGEQRFRVCGFSPPLPYADDSFDLIYAVSVFTHLNEGDQLAWLTELSRLLSPGGAALLTTAGLHAFGRPPWAGMPAHTAEELAGQLGRLEQLQFVFVSYGRDLDSKPAKYPGISGDYGLAFQTEEWTRELWGEVLDIEQVLPAALAGHQDVVLATQPLPRAQ